MIVDGWTGTMHGLVGTGKSTITQTFAKTSFEEEQLKAGFFRSQDFEDQSSL